MEQGATPEGPSSDSEDIRMTSASVLPPVPPDVLVDVYLVEQIIEALGTIGKIIDTYHTGIVFSVQEHDAVEMPDVPEEFTVEWYAINFPFGAFLPKIKSLSEGDNVGLEWENESGAFYSPLCKPNRWTKGRTAVGTISGKTLAKYGAWCVEYCEGQPAYQAYEVWDRPIIVPGKTRRWVPSMTCSTFTEDSFNALHRLSGGKQGTGFREGGTKALATPTEILKRSYLPLIAQSQPTVVDLSRPDEAAGVRSFYVELSRAARGEGDSGGGLKGSEFLRLLADRLDFYYIYDLPKDEYLKMELIRPYFALTRLYQPMSLPWQKLDLDGSGDFEDPARFAPPSNDVTFIEELSELNSEIQEVLWRKVPPILGQKLKVSLLPVVTLSALILIASIKLDNGLPFTSGVAVGVVLGGVGVQLLQLGKKT